MSKTTRTAKEYLPDGRKTGFCIAPPSLGISGDLTKTDGPTRIREWLTSSAQDSHASRFRSPGSKREKMTSGTCGLQRSNAFVWYDRALRFWKTCQGCLLPDTSDRYSETWPKRGTMRNGVCWARTMLVPHTGGKGCGSWPTPTKQDGENNAGPSQWGRNSDPLNVAVHRGGTSTRRTYPTPRAEDSQCAGGHRGKPDTLHAQGKIWASPKASASGPDYARKNRPNSGSDDLATQVRGQLNPGWVEWLMGWPIGWTSLEPLPTDRFRAWLRGSRIEPAD